MIVLIDSGINIAQLKQVKAVDIGYGILDENGHGSILADIILKILSINNVNLEIVSLKILDKFKRGTLDGIFKALDYCLELKPSCICMALSISNYNSIEIVKLKQYITKIAKEKIYIITAFENGTYNSYPANFKEVYGCLNSLAYTDYNIENIKKNLIVNATVDSIYFMFQNQIKVIGGNSLLCGIATAYFFIIKFIYKKEILFPDILYKIAEFNKFNTRVKDYKKINAIKMKLKTMKLTNIDNPYLILNDLNKGKLFLEEIKNYNYNVGKKYYLQLHHLLTWNDFVTYLYFENE
ncbi:hypothetical protein [Peptoniphilus harei]|uniref:Peptidase S8/S53 domain-containing protein n=1 Tax=Peptoniphilus harei TaxID=54005 RepID=A0A943SS01_9FIRM|nr:hypothetical protein [Peptoniphilus harei]MBS6535610.1 hypothetical protein [Peptoniphilus harei]